MFNICITDMLCLIYNSLTYIIIFTEEIVFQSSTGKLAGYVDPEASTSKEQAVAKKALGFYVRGITNSEISRMVSFFAVDNNCSAEVLYKLVVKIISQLWFISDLNVLTIIGNFFKLNINITYCYLNFR